MKIRQLQKQKQQETAAAAAAAAAASDNLTSGEHASETQRVSAAQLRLQKDITTLELPPNIKVVFPNPSDLFNFKLSINPQQGYYKSGAFEFKVEINNNFPMEPPKIKCLNRIYHPNIDLDGNVCLNILREDWSPVLNLNSIFIGLNFLFLEPNPNDPLNKDAANVLAKNKNLFTRNVRDSMRGGYVDNEYYDRVV